MFAKIFVLLTFALTVFTQSVVETPVPLNTAFTSTLITEFKPNANAKTEEKNPTLNTTISISNVRLYAKPVATEYKKVQMLGAGSKKSEFSLKHPETANVQTKSEEKIIEVGALNTIDAKNVIVPFEVTEVKILQEVESTAPISIKTPCTDDTPASNCFAQTAQQYSTVVTSKAVKDPFTVVLTNVTSTLKVTYTPSECSAEATKFGLALTAYFMLARAF